MKYINLSIEMTDDLGLKKVVFNENTTDLPSDSVLLSNIGMALIKSIHLNSDSVKTQDLLNDIGIKLPEKE